MPLDVQKLVSAITAASKAARLPLELFSDIFIILTINSSQQITDGFKVFDIFCRNRNLRRPFSLDSEIYAAR